LIKREVQGVLHLIDLDEDLLQVDILEAHLEEDSLELLPLGEGTCKFQSFLIIEDRLRSLQDQDPHDPLLQRKKAIRGIA
jgi:hypothetical protein